MRIARMMRIMCLIIQIQRRKHILINPQPLRLILRRQPQVRAQIYQDVRRLVDQQWFAVLASAGDAQGGRREGGRVAVGVTRGFGRACGLYGRVALFVVVGDVVVGD